MASRPSLSHKGEFDTEDPSFSEFRWRSSISLLRSLVPCLPQPLSSLQSLTVSSHYPRWMDVGSIDLTALKLHAYGQDGYKTAEQVDDVIAVMDIGSCL